MAILCTGNTLWSYLWNLFFNLHWCTSLLYVKEKIAKNCCLEMIFKEFLKKEIHTIHRKNYLVHVKLLILGITLLIASIAISTENLSFAQIPNENFDSTLVVPPNATSDANFLDLVSDTEGHKQTLRLSINDLIFDVEPIYNNEKLESMKIKLKPELYSLYKQIGNDNDKIVFVYPIFTQSAYEKHGFYDYYKQKCNSDCLTIPIDSKNSGFYASSINTAMILRLLNYSYVTDIDVDKNPDVLKKYKRVIILHNEYVTKKEFDAITSHSDVIYFYPNALYAEIKSDYDTNTITLIKGHGFPSYNVTNGFNWKSNNSKFEYDVKCNNWNFYTKSNNTMLNCYPEYRVLYDSELLRYLQVAEPTDITSDISKWIRYDDPYLTHQLLLDYDVEGKYIPKWVQNSAILLLNGDISRAEFADIINYLYNVHIIK